jgi:hypothetical protein
MYSQPIYVQPNVIPVQNPLHMLPGYQQPMIAPIQQPIVQPYYQTVIQQPPQMYGNNVSYQQPVLYNQPPPMQQVMYNQPPSYNQNRMMGTPQNPSSNVMKLQNAQNESFRKYCKK